MLFFQTYFLVLSFDTIAGIMQARVTSICSSAFISLYQMITSAHMIFSVFPAPASFPRGDFIWWMIDPHRSIFCLPDIKGMERGPALSSLSSGVLIYPYSETFSFQSVSISFSQSQSVSVSFSQL